MHKKSASTVRVFYPHYSPEELLQRLSEGVEKLRRSLKLSKVVLFGSYAKGRHTVASDIDLLVTYAGEHRENAYALVKKTLNISGLEPHVYTTGEYEEMRVTIGRMTEDGITIFQDQ